MLPLRVCGRLECVSAEPVASLTDRNVLTMAWLESFIAEFGRPETESVRLVEHQEGETNLKEMPYCDTASKPLFQTSVTSHALVADSLQERKAETALPPTVHAWISLSSFIAIQNAREEDAGLSVPSHECAGMQRRGSGRKSTSKTQPSTAGECNVLSTDPMTFLLSSFNHTRD